MLVSEGRERFAFLLRFTVLYHFFMSIMLLREGLRSTGRPTAAECSDLGVAQLGAVVIPASVAVMRGACTSPLTWQVHL